MIAPVEMWEVRGTDPLSGESVGAAAAFMTPEMRRLAWFLQWQSHQPGGLKVFAHDLINANLRTRLGSPTMHRIGITPATVYSGDAFEDVCRELDYFPSGNAAVLTRELDACLLIDSWVPSEREQEESRRLLRPENRKASAAKFLLRARERACALAAHLRAVCIDGQLSWEVPYLRDLPGAIAEAMKRYTDRAETLAASTKNARIVHDGMEFAGIAGGLVVIFGPERIGKSKSAEQFAVANPDKCRLISLSAGTTDRLFYGEIATALYCDREGRDTAGLREVIRDTVASRSLMLIFDEAHCLFGTSAKASIKRIEYIRTEFVNRGIPVVLIVTPQFAHRLQGLERSSDFNLRQLRGRVTRWVAMDRKISVTDLERVARFHVPEIDAESLEIVTTAALATELPLAALHNTIQEARVLAAKTSASSLNLDIFKAATNHSLWTSSCLAATIPAPETDSGRMHSARRSTPKTIAAGTKAEAQPASSRADTSAPSTPAERAHRASRSMPAVPAA